MFITHLSQNQFLVKDKSKRHKVSIILGWSDDLAKDKLKEANIILTDFKVSNAGIPENVFLVNSPGEYDINDVFIRGIQDKDHIIYALDLAGEKLVYLNGLSTVNLDDKKIEQLGEVHILIISINGGEMDARAAAKLVNRIEPRLVIPMNYQSDELTQFLKIMGVEKQPKEDSVDLQADSLSPEGLLIKVLKFE